MAKEFHNWLSELENTIEDTNTWIGRNLNLYAGHFTDLQKRMMFADILEPNWEVCPDAWLNILCLREVGNVDKIGIIGKDMYEEYIEDDSSRFVERLRIKIKDGWRP